MQEAANIEIRTQLLNPPQLGVGSAIYFPNKFETIINGAPWKVINTGSSKGFTGFFHGRMDIDFSQETLYAGPGTPNISEIDLRSIIRHEGLHILGFASGMEVNSGQPNITAGQNKAFTTFDKFIKLNHNSTADPVIVENGSSNWILNPTLNANDLFSSCNSGIDLALFHEYFDGNQFNKYYIFSGQPGNSSNFSHLVNYCPEFHDPPFLMEPSLNKGESRSIQGEEKNILINLGYTIDGGSQDCQIFGTDDYGPSCTGLKFEQEICPGQTAIFDISISDLIGNDINATGVSDLLALSSEDTNIQLGQDGSLSQFPVLARMFYVIYQ